jgi:hypothetical protein
MPIQTKMAKSGEKKVVKQKRANVGGRLNKAATAVSRGDSDLSPGVHNETMGENRSKTRARRVTLANNRRRH